MIASERKGKYRLNDHLSLSNQERIEKRKNPEREEHGNRKKEKWTGCHWWRISLKAFQLILRPFGKRGRKTLWESSNYNRIWRQFKLREM